MKKDYSKLLSGIIVVLGIVIIWLLYNVAVPLAISWVLLKVFPSITWNLVQTTVAVALIRLALSTLTNRGGNK